ncbi:hypothetical protein JST97_10325 [bacterium]|nr:hypothetical protein [bacterium]
MRKLLLAMLLASLPAWSQVDPPVVLEARSVFGDIVRYGAPFQAVVEVNVTTPLNLETSLQIDGGHAELDCRVPIKLAPGKRSYAIPVASAQYGQDVHLVGGGAPGATTQMQPSVATDQDYLALVLAPRKNQFAYLGGYKSLLSQGEFRVNQPRKGAELPDLWWTYLGHNVIVLYDLPALKLSDRVESALLDYVQAGGQLVLVSNSDPQELQGSRLSELAPLRASRLVEGRLRGQLAPGAEEMISSKNAPLLLRRVYGSGSVWQVTSPIDTQDVLGTKQTQAVWQKILSEQSGFEVRKSFEEFGDRLSVLPELPAPATAALAWYLAGYVLVVIPAIYVYLRRKDQVLRLIVVVPICSVLITSLAYFLNSSGRGRQLVLRELGTAWAYGGKPEVVLRQQGVLFSPAALSFSLDFPADTLMRPRYRARDEQSHILNCRGESLSLEPERLRQWGLSRWAGLGLRRLSGPIGLEVQETPGVLKVTIKNGSDLPTCQAVLATTSSLCSAPFEVHAGIQKVDLEVSKQSNLQDVLERGELGPLRREDAASLANELGARRQPGPVLVMKVSDPRLAVMHFKDLHPKEIRTTYLVISEGQP